MLFVNLVYFQNYENFHFCYILAKILKIKIFQIDLYVYIINRKEVLFIGEYINFFNNFESFQKIKKNEQ